MNTREKGDKVKINGVIREIENITQWDKDTQRYKFAGVSGWYEIKEEQHVATINIYIIKYNTNTNNGYQTTISDRGYINPLEAEQELLEQGYFNDNDTPDYTERNYVRGMGWAKIEKVEVVEDEK